MEIFLLYTVFRLAMMVIDGLKNRCFELTDRWKVSFNKKPISFCFYIIFYSIMDIIILTTAWFAGYNLLTK